MEKIDHFSHNHPLISLSKKVDDHDQKDHLCSICGLPILSCPSYTCSNTDCKFFLHKPCAGLPKELDNPRHHNSAKRSHNLYLERQKSPPANSQNFTYHCRTCNSDVHPLLAVPLEIKSNHESHPSHPLVAHCREIFSLCDACGEEHKGFFFSCHECSFWIHQDCTVLRSIVKLASHPHPFILTYSLASDTRGISDAECEICGKSVRLLNFGLYLCCECNSYAHVNCAKSNMENLKSETGLEFFKLPADKGDRFPSLVIRRNLESNPAPGDEKSMIEKLHKHDLKFHEHGFCSSSREACDLVCDVCVQPVNTSYPFYSCLDSDCNFLAHNTCANLLPSFDLSIRRDFSIKISLFKELGRYYFGSIYPCFLCHRPWNGFCYYDGDTFFPLFFDLDCITALKCIKHASHGSHVLFRATRGFWSNVPLKCCSDDTYFYDVYRCIICPDFYIHVKCALLPKVTRHILHEHPLELITPLREQENNCCFCEFCEKDIDHKYWYYGCRECEQYFHINCIPSIGYLSKVKFGKTLVDNNVHSHPLILTRMLTYGRNKMCGYCKKIIQGFVDEMALGCSDCDFWIHFSCARDKSSTRLSLYSEIDFF